MAITHHTNVSRVKENLVSPTTSKQSSTLKEDFTPLDFASRSLVMCGENVCQRQICHKNLRGTLLDPTGMNVEVCGVRVDMPLSNEGV